jgi:predicted RNA binding protein YcfA (HicA-like mRNA interferase family)
VVSSRQAIKADGWILVRVVGDHHQFRHPTKGGKVTVPHPVKDLPIQVVVSIERQSGVGLRGRRRRWRWQGAISRPWSSAARRTTASRSPTFPGRAVRLSITMDEALAGAVDRAAAAQGFTRSGFLAEAARRLLRERAEPAEPAQ